MGAVMGTSAGALSGSLFSAGYSPKQVLILLRGSKAACVSHLSCSECLTWHSVHHAEGLLVLVCWQTLKTKSMRSSTACGHTMCTSAGLCVMPCEG